MLNVKKHRIVVLIQQYLFLIKINLYEKGLYAGIINFVKKKPYYFLTFINYGSNTKEALKTYHRHFFNTLSFRKMYISCKKK